MLANEGTYQAQDIHMNSSWSNALSFMKYPIESKQDHSPPMLSVVPYYIFVFFAHLMY